MREIDRLQSTETQEEMENQAILRTTVLGRPVDWWQGVYWTNEHLKIDIETISKTDRFGLDELVRLYRSGAPADAYGVPNSHDRLRSQIKYLTENKTFSAPPLLLETPAGTKIIDGFHRLAALIILEMTRTEQTVWAARHTA